jgi:predicted transcriptional regulator
MHQLRSNREALGLSQSKLARLSGVSRFKICTFELGDSKLTPEEQKCIHVALLAESDRLRNLPAVNFDEKAGVEVLV